jgi:hypothetical protein
MKRAIAPLLVAVLLAAAGGYAWMRAEDERRTARGRQALATMEFGAAMPTPGDQATADYWRAHYAALAQAQDASGAVVEHDPAVLFVAANAAYRALDRTSGGQQALVQRLDGIIKSYAEVIKMDGAPEDAAYNYELLVRQRDAVAKGRAAIVSSRPIDDTHSAIHGLEGAPPKGADTNSFKILVPRQTEERNEELKSGASPVRNRKG